MRRRGTTTRLRGSMPAGRSGRLPSCSRASVSTSMLHRVLDFGAGTGLLTDRLVAEGATVHAVDSSAGMLEVLEAKIADRGWTGVTFGAGLPDSSEVFDLVVCSSVCSFLDDYPATARGAGRPAPARRCVRPMGLGTVARRRRRPWAHPRRDHRGAHRRGSARCRGPDRVRGRVRGRDDGAPHGARHPTVIRR